MKKQKVETLLYNTAIVLIALFFISVLIVVWIDWTYWWRVPVSITAVFFTTVYLLYLNDQRRDHE